MEQIQAFLAAIAHDWIGRMSGGAGLLLTVLSYFLPLALVPRAFLAMGVACLFYASFRAWQSEHQKHQELLAQLAPRLEFVRQPRDKPFFEEVLAEGGVKTRWLRLALRNLGGAEIPQARVVLEACTPNAAATVHLEHELQPMGKPQGALTAPIPPHGTVLFDVAFECVPAGMDYGTIRICYAQAVPNDLPNLGDSAYALTLRAEGAGPAVRCNIDLGGKLTWRLDGLKQLST